jgi:RNA polymerase sigma-70 factor (ECF subfamily)
MPNQSAYARINTDHKVQPAQVGDSYQIETLVMEHYAYVRRLALSILDNGSQDVSAEADDAAQETFVAACQALPGYRSEASMKTWLTTIAVNTCRGRLRKRKVQQALHTTLEAIHSLIARPATPEEIAIQNEADRQLWKAVDNLEDKHRLPVILRYVHDLTVPEIAEILRMREGTVHSRLHYARQKLHQQLQSLAQRPLQAQLDQSDPSEQSVSIDSSRNRMQRTPMAYGSGQTREEVSDEV